MRLNRLKVRQFGRFREEFAVDFSAGLNLIVGPNESGKSTIVRAIRGVLFGIRDRRTDEDGLWRWIPFGGGTPEGSLELESGGRNYLIERRFDNHRTTVSEIGGAVLFDGAANPEGRTEDVRRYAEVLSSLIGSSSESLLVNTALVRQGDLPPELDAEVRRLIAGGASDHQKALDTLEASYYELTRINIENPDKRGKNNPREIEQLEARIEKLKESLAEAEAAERERSTAADSLGEVESRLDELEGELEDRTRDFETFGDYHSLIEQRAALSKESGYLKEKLDKDSARREEIDKLTKELGETGQQILENREALTPLIGRHGRLVAAVEADVGRLEQLTHENEEKAKEIEPLDKELKSIEARYAGDWESFDNALGGFKDKQADLSTLKQEVENLEDTERALKERCPDPSGASDAVLASAAVEVEAHPEAAELGLLIEKHPFLETLDNRLDNEFQVVYSAGHSLQGPPLPNWLIPLVALLVGAVTWYSLTVLHIGFEAGISVTILIATWLLLRYLLKPRPNSSCIAAQNELNRIVDDLFFEQYPTWETYLKLKNRREDLRKSVEAGLVRFIEKLNGELSEKRGSLDALKSDLAELEKRFAGFGESIDLAEIQQQATRRLKLKQELELASRLLEKNCAEHETVTQQREERDRQFEDIASELEKLAGTRDAEKIEAELDRLTGADAALKAKQEEQLDEQDRERDAARLRELEADYDSARRSMDQMERDNPALKSLKDDPAALASDVRRRREQLDEMKRAIELAKEEKRDLLHKVRTEGSGGMNVDVTAERIEELEETLAHLRRRAGALSLAFKELTEAAAEFSATHKDRLADAATDKFNELAESGAGRTLVLTEDFSPLYIPEGGREAIDTAHLSQGARDQLAMAIRLAVAEYIGGERLPLILDDPFVNFDLDRLEAAREALTTLADGTQVLLFTHDERLTGWGGNAISLGSG